MNAKTATSYQPWNKGKLVGRKSPLRLRDIWGIRIRLELAQNVRDLALFDLAIDSKLRACDLTKLRVSDVAHGNHVVARAMVMQQKTKRPVQFEITAQTATRCGGMGNTGPRIRQKSARVAIRGMRKRRADPLIESVPNTVRMVPFINCSVAPACSLTATLNRARLPFSIALLLS